jgi:peptidoglycan/xylan/chitin deacetylase (PgdA/CDA1 family)
MPGSLLRAVHLSMSPFRLDRFLTVHVFHRFGLAANGSSGPRVPILMYHSISDRMTRGIHPYFETSTSPRVFERQMRFLHENGYAAMGLEDVIGVLSNGKAAPPKPVCITFDDGFRDFLTEAFPALTKYGFSGTVFLPTGFIGDSRKTFKGRECLTWSEVRGLHSRGVKFGSHTVTHSKLDKMDGEGLEFELSESKKRIEDQTSAKVETFAYPFAFPEENRTFVPKLKRAALDAGFKSGVTTMIGRASAKNSPLFLKRIPLNDFDDLSLLQAKLEGSYDWLHALQRLSKFLRKPLNGRGQRGYAT